MAWYKNKDGLYININAFACITSGPSSNLLCDEESEWVYGYGPGTCNKTLGEDRHLIEDEFFSHEEAETFICWLLQSTLPLVTYELFRKLYPVPEKKETE